MKNPLHFLFAILILSFAAIPPAKAQDAPSGEPKVRTLADWQAYITKDAKMSAITKILGKPDKVQKMGDATLAYVWAGALDDGTKNGTALALIVAQVNGETVVVGVFEPTTQTVVKFPWCDTALGIAPNPLDAKDAQGNPLFHRSEEGFMVNARNERVDDSGKVMRDDSGAVMTTIIGSN